MQLFTPIDHIEPYLTTQDATALWDRLHRDLSNAGFKRVFYAASQRRQANSARSPRDTIVKSSYGAEFDSFFVDGAAFTADVNTQWAIDSQGAVSWDLTRRLKADGQLSAHQIAIHERCLDLGLINGYTISLRNYGSGLITGFGLSADDIVHQKEVDDVWTEHRKLLLCVLSAFDLSTRMLPQVPDGEELTARQREVLAWVGDGKTIDDIAEIMGLHRSTIVKHMREARERLRVTNTLQAVMRATLQGQIYR
ncbi:helix-turn-helix transcriptional regulator [Gymnodinialimonas hymeniacidonis]|uniref:helix-turn-helix transcriptional regulator n=1 Tax=Gymnodinialimonas hymeniacidonis TaxID=3126508 RepID=UPI0034C5DCE4